MRSESSRHPRLNAGRSGALLARRVASASRRQLLSGDLAVVEVDRAVGEDLVVLVTLAGDEHRVAGLRELEARVRSPGGDRPRPRRRATMPRTPSSTCRMMPTGSSERGLSLVITAASAYARDGCAHQRPLVGIAVAAAPEHRDHAARGDVLDRKQRLLKRVRRVGVVDDDRERLARTRPARDDPAPAGPPRGPRRPSQAVSRWPGHNPLPRVRCSRCTRLPAEGRRGRCPAASTSVNDAPVADSSSSSARTIASGSAPDGERPGHLGGHQRAVRVVDVDHASAEPRSP